MAAAATDKLKKLSKRWVGQIGAGGVADGTTTTVPLSSTTNLPTDTAVVVVIDRVDVNGVATPSLEETIIGVVSGSNLTDCVRGSEGTAQAHNAGAVVEVLFTAKGWNDVVDAFLVEHTQLGAHKIIKRTGTITSSATPTPNIDTQDIFTITALAAAAELQTPSGTPANGQTLVIRIKDNGTARALTYVAIYRALGVTLPTTTVLSKTLYLGCIYNSTDTKWDVVAVAQQA